MGSDAKWCVEQLDSLRGLTQDAASIVAASRVAFGPVQEVLTVLTAAIDAEQAA